MPTTPTPLKVILIDIDGVIIPEGDLYFSTRLARKTGVSPEHVLPFFLNEFYECLRGNLDLKIEMEKYLSHWNWHGDVDEILTYWFEHERTTDPQLLSWIDTIRTHGIHVYIASNQEKYRASYLLDTVGLSQFFTGTFFSYEIHHLKDSPEYFHAVLQSLHYTPEHILFIDDIKEYIDIAQSFGIQTQCYEDIPTLKEGLHTKGFSSIAELL